MKNFKKTIALLVIYVITMIMLPIGNLKANATKKVPQYLTINDMYITSISQYQNKALVTYERDGNFILSLFTNGTEKIIKEFEQPSFGYQSLSIIDGNDKTYVNHSIYDFHSPENTYYSFDFNTQALTEITADEIPTISTSSNPNISHDTISDNSIKNEIIEKINNKYNTDYTLYSEENKTGNTHVYITQITVNNGKPMYEYSAYASYGNVSEQYFGL